MTKNVTDVFSSLVIPDLKSIKRTNISPSNHPLTRASTTTAPPPVIKPPVPVPTKPEKPAPTIVPAPAPIIQPAPKEVPRPGRSPHPHRPIQPGICPLR